MFKANCNIFTGKLATQWKVLIHSLVLLVYYMKRLRLSITKATGDKIFLALDVDRFGDLAINIIQSRHQQNPLATLTVYLQYTYTDIIVTCSYFACWANLLENLQIFHYKAVVVRTIVALL